MATRRGSRSKSGSKSASSRSGGRGTKKKSGARRSSAVNEESRLAAAIAAIRERLGALGARLESAMSGGWPEAVGWVTVVVAVGAAWWIGVPRLEARVRSEVDPTAAITVRLVDPPTWLDADIVEEIEADAARVLRADPFDRASLLEAGEVVAESGWFSSVGQVRRQGPDLVEIETESRTPAAMVRWQGYDYLVDVDGHRLPFQIRARRGEPRGDLPVTIIGVGTAPGRAGDRWESHALRSGLSLLSVMDGHAWMPQVDAIDVSQHDSTHHLAILTDRGSRFEWGPPPGAERVAEPTARKKLSFLDDAAAGHPSGRIDAGLESTWMFYVGGMSERTGSRRP